MVDALVPFADTLVQRVNAGDPLPGAWRIAAAAATAAAQKTADLMPAMGRARAHGDKALGVVDPGAISFALIIERVHELLAVD